MEAEWCGSRKGRARVRRPSGSVPARLWIIETSSASLGSIGGRIPDSRLASMDLPAPGGPTIRRLWPPAAAISSTRLADSWPLMSLRSGRRGLGVGQPRLGCRQHLGALEMVDQRQQVGRRQDGHVAGPGGLAAAAAGQIRPSSRRWRRSRREARRRPARIEPSSAISPSARKPSISSAGRTPIATIRPSAIGRSKWLPSLITSAGDRLTVMRLGGSASPMAQSAARTRSRLSPTALSGRPTTAGHAARDLHLHVDGKRVHPLERHRLDPRHHGCPLPGLRLPVGCGWAGRDRCRALRHARTSPKRKYLAFVKHFRKLLFN